MNLVQLANDLEYVPKEQLAEMSQDPNSSYPAYLVLSEIQRRTLNEKNYQAMEQQPTTTVAEEVVGEFMQPQLAQNQSQGLQGGTPQSATPLPDSNISAGLSGVPTAPMQMAASGGLTGYAAGDRTALNASFQNPNANQFSSTSNQDIPKEVLEEVETIGSSRGADFLKFAGVLKEDGSIDPLGATLAVASLHPIGRAAGWAAKAGIGIGKKYLPGLASGIKGLAQSAYKKGFTKTGQVPAEITRKGQSLPLGQAAKELGYGKGTSNIMTRGDVFSPAKTLGTLSTAAVPAAIVKNISDSAQEQYAIDEEKKLTAEQLRIQELEKQLAERENLKGLAGATAEKDNTGNWRDLARLGAGIMSAKNVGEIGDTVTSIVDAQDKRDVQGLQSRYMQIQTEKLEADIAAMPLKELIAAQNSLSASIKAKNESGSMPTPEEIIQINKLYEFYSAEIARRQGFVAETKSAGQDANVIASYG